MLSLRLRPRRVPEPRRQPSVELALAICGTGAAALLLKLQPALLLRLPTLLLRLLPALLLRLLPALLLRLLLALLLKALPAVPPKVLPALLLTQRAPDAIASIAPPPALFRFCTTIWGRVVEACPAT